MFKQNYITIFDVAKYEELSVSKKLINGERSN